jgi:predicted transcriptional regulator
LLAARATTPTLLVAELGNKQPLPLRIDAEVIDAAAHFTDRDLRLEHQRGAPVVCASKVAGHIRLANNRIARANTLSSSRY